MLVTDQTHGTGGTNTTAMPVYDGAANVIALVDPATGAPTAQFAYGPYGQTLSSAGTAAAQDGCPFRFSTKYLDEETGLYYYGYRYYDPAAGSWLSRDPLGEAGGLNLYGFVGNDPVNTWDYLGLSYTKLGTKALTKLLGGDAAAIALAKTVRSLFQNHHVLPKPLWKQYGTRLAALGFERDAIENLILLPKGKAADIILKLGRTYHKGFPKAHKLYNGDVSQQVIRILEKESAGTITKGEAAAGIRLLQTKLRKELSENLINLTAKKGELPVGAAGIVRNTPIVVLGESGLFLVGPFIGVVEGSEAGEYIQDVAIYQDELEELHEAGDILLDYTGRDFTLEEYFPESGIRHLDFFNPFAIIQASVSLGIVSHLPKAPQMSEELKAELELASKLVIHFERQMNPPPYINRDYERRQYLRDKYDLDSGDPLEYYDAYERRNR